MIENSVSTDAQVGEGTQIWRYTRVEAGAVIGDDCILGQNVYVGKNVVIGSHVKIQNNVSVYEGVELEDYVFCGPSMVFTNDLCPRSEFPKTQEERTRTLVKRGASIGANATILCGITIGEYALIGAGSVVVKPVEAHAVMTGSPARQIGWACRCGVRCSDLTELCHP